MVGADDDAGVCVGPSFLGTPSRPGGGCIGIEAWGVDARSPRRVRCQPASQDPCCIGEATGVSASSNAVSTPLRVSGVAGSAAMADGDEALAPASGVGLGASPGPSAGAWSCRKGLQLDGVVALRVGATSATLWGASTGVLSACSGVEGTGRGGVAPRVSASDVRASSDAESSMVTVSVLPEESRLQ